MYTIKTIESFEEFQRLEPEWNALLAQSDSDVPFMTFEWLSAWWRTYGDEGEVFVPVVMDADGIAAAAPLMRVKMRWRGLPVRAVILMANCHSSRTGFVVRREHPAAAAEIMRFIRDACRYDLLFFDFVLRGTVTERALREAGMPYRVMQGWLSPYLPIEGSWEDYLNGRKKSFREKLRYNENVVRRAGEGRVVVHADGDIEKAFDDVLHISRRTWKFGEHTAIASSGKDTAFYRRLAHAMAARGWLRLYLFSLQEQPVAFRYTLLYKRKLFALKSGFDEAWRKIAPNKFLNRYVIRSAFEQGLLEYDMLGKHDPFKMEWTSVYRDQCKYALFGDSIPGAVLSLAETRIIPRLRELAGRRSREDTPARASG